MALIHTNSSQTASSVAVVYGNGSGSFTAPATVFSPGMNHGATSLALGDFDADSHADIAVGVTNPPCSGGSCQSTDVYILYGNGAGSFTQKKVFSGVPGSFQFSSGDLNLDGRTDLVGVIPLSKVLALYGQPSRTVVANSISAPRALGPIGVIADFNGDGHNDFATLGTTTSGAQAIDLFLAKGNGPFHDGANTRHNECLRIREPARGWRL